MESLERMVRLYLPKESVMVPLPEVLITATASKGLLAEISYTVPLMVTNCGFVFCWAMMHSLNNNKIQKKCSRFPKLLN